MIVSIVGCSCYVYREPGDPVFRPNRSKHSWSPPGWYGAESRLLYNVRKILNGRGYGLIKKRMWRDGHMFGSDHTQYLRSRNLKAIPSLYIYHADYALEVAAESYNVLGRARLDVVYGAGREDDPDFERACREWVRRKEIAFPCYPGLVGGRGDHRRLRLGPPPLPGLHGPGTGQGVPGQRPRRVVPTHRPARSHDCDRSSADTSEEGVTNTLLRSPDDEDHGLVQVRRSRPDRHPGPQPRRLVRQGVADRDRRLYTPLFLVVEADNVSDAIDELSDNPTFGHQIHVPEGDLGDYPEDDRHYDGSGRVIDLDHVMVHGRERTDLPFPVKYHAEGEPAGIDPRHFATWQYN